VRPDPYAWAVHPEEVAVLAVLACGYAILVARFRAERWRIACFAAGLTLIAATELSPLHSLTFQLLTMHLLQNVALAEWAPLLCVLGIPPAAAAAFTRLPAANVLTHPAVTLPVWLGTYFVWHVPALYDAALEHPDSLLHLEHVCYFVAGCALWWPLVHRRFAPAVKAGYVAAAFLFGSPLGLLLTFAQRPVYDWYERGRHLWGLRPLADQQLAGVTMVSEQALVFFAVFSVFFFRFLREA
jgi:cytochrome c oxidase assembly factor CtaG